MKYNYFLLSLLLLTFFSCNRQDQETPIPTDFGYLSMNISVSITEEPASGRIEAVPTDTWKVTIFNASDDSEAMVFDPYSSAPAEVQLTTGEYYIEAHSNNFQEAAFENPYYFGRSANFTIDKEELKTIDIDAELANSKVAINYSPNVTSTFDSYSGTVSVVSSGASLVYNETETREGYFVSEPLAVVVDLSYTKLDGSFITRQFTANIDAQPKTLYNVNVDATLEDGKITMNINVDESFNEEVIELGDTDPNPNAAWVAGDDWVDTRDGEVYGTVQIGEQVWISENLRYLPEVQSTSEWQIASSSNEKAYGVYDYSGTVIADAKAIPNYSRYGVLYNWHAAMDGSLSSDSAPSGVQGACPADWHLPSDLEWKEMELHLGMSQDDVDMGSWRGTNQGSKIAGILGLWSDGILIHHIDFGISGLDLIPGGLKLESSNEFQRGIESFNWSSSTPLGSSRPFARVLFVGSTGIYRSTYSAGTGMSVKCIKN